MHLHEITFTTDAPACPVFAGTYDEAAAIFVTWYAAKHGRTPGEFGIERRKPDSADLDQAHLALALRSRIPGIGRYHRDRGWLITPTGSDVGEV